MSNQTPESVQSTDADQTATAVVVEKVNLLGLSQSKLESFFESIGEKRFRATQVLKWIHQMGVDNFDDMTNISKALREKLNRLAEVRAPEVLEQLDSADGTRKFLIKVTGGSIIETVLIPDGDRGTLCVSSQVGCALDCSFCSTGKQGFNRDLTPAEIIGQVWLAAKSYGQFGENRPRIITNVVMMGMGEPLLNFDPVVDSMNLMMHDNCYGLSKRRVTLSTSGVVPALDKLNGVTDVCLAISLHAPMTSCVTSWCQSTKNTRSLCCLSQRSVISLACRIIVARSPSNTR